MKLSEAMHGHAALHYGGMHDYADKVAQLESDLEAWTKKGALFVEQGDRLSKMEDALKEIDEALTSHRAYATVGLMVTEALAGDKKT